MMTPCPDFDLDPPEPFNPALLLGGKNSADAFVLVLALAFNDLKDANWVRQQLDHCTPDDINKIDATVGQWQEMRIRFTRHVMGILHELLIAIESASRAGLLQDSVFQKALLRCQRATRDAWTALVDSATNQRGTSDLRQYLHDVRNRAAFITIGHAFGRGTNTAL